MKNNRTLRAEKAIRRYSYAIIAFCVLGVLYVHVPHLWGCDWTLYRVFGKWGSIILHFFEVPVIVLNLYVSYFGLKRFTWDKRGAYVSMRHSVFAVNTVFITIECVQLFFSFHGNAPDWEKWSYGVIVVLMFGAICYLLYLMRLLNNYETLDGLEQDGQGFFHPSNEHDLVELVKMAARNRVQIRCRGAAHSMAHAIYAGPRDYANKVSVQSPPQSAHMNVLLDRYNGFRWLNDREGIVEVDAGIHLGADPNDKQRRSTIQNSLLFQAAQRGFTLDDLGGITHQTISGFLMTGCSGGSLHHSIEDNIEGFSIIDGSGNVEWYWRGEDLFNALLCSLGVQGIISKVQMRLKPMYIIVGEERTVSLPCVDIDLSGTPGAVKSLLSRSSYTRLLWWPQPKVERVVVWNADRKEPVPPGFEPKPYRQLSKSKFIALLQQLGGSMIFTVLGNQNLLSVWKKMFTVLRSFSDSLYELQGPSLLSWILASLGTIVLAPFAIVFVLFLLILSWIQVDHGPWLARLMVSKFQPLTKRGEENDFEDFPQGSLPMDNEINDTILGTEFTELWIPMAEADKAMKFFSDLYKDSGYRACGYYATEVYAAKASKIWLSPAYNTDVLRIDLFWFANNEGDPSAKGGFFNQFWDGLRNAGISFRVHWGKFLPGYPGATDPDESYRQWAEYFDREYPKWKEFMALRKKRDPLGIFLTEYWSLHLLGRKS